MYLIVFFEGDGIFFFSNIEIKFGLIFFQSGDNGLEQSNDMFIVYIYRLMYGYFIFMCFFYIVFIYIWGVYFIQQKVM